MPPKKDDVLDKWVDAFGPWDKDQTFQIPVVRPKRLLDVVDKVNDEKSGRATITKVSRSGPGDGKGYVDAWIDYKHDKDKK
jgi:hypothetical protein